MSTRIGTRVFPGPQNLALFVAEDRGLFARHEVEADIRITVSSDEQRTTLADGTVEVIHSAVDNAVYMVEASGVDTVIVSGGSNGMNDVVVRPEIRDLEEVRGKTVVVDAPNTAYAFQLYTILAMNGIARGDYDVHSAGGATQRLAAMRDDERRVAAMLNPPWNFVAGEEGFRNLGPAVDWIGRYQADGAFVLRAWGEANADGLVGYLRAIIEGYRWAAAGENRAEATEILARRLGIDNDTAARSVAAAVGPGGGLSADSRFDLEGFANLLRIREEIDGTWGGRIPAPGKYLDLSYHERALAGL